MYASSSTTVEPSARPNVTSWASRRTTLGRPDGVWITSSRGAVRAFFLAAPPRERDLRGAGDGDGDGARGGLATSRQTHRTARATNRYSRRRNNPCTRV